MSKFLKLKESELINLIQNIILEEEESNSELEQIFQEKGYSLPEACKTKVDSSSGQETSNIKACFDEFSKQNQKVMDIASALQTMMTEKGIQKESKYRRNYRNRYF
ncbi:hypothetical protein EBU91_03320 [bacterium]|nr:hypothetical protein [bacterium]